MPDNEREKNHKELLLEHDSKLTRKSSLRKPKENNNKESFVSILLHAELEPNDRREDAPHFNFGRIDKDSITKCFMFLAILRLSFWSFLRTNYVKQ